MFDMKGFCVSAIGAIHDYHDPLVFLLCHGNQSYWWNSLLLTTWVELHPKNIHAKFHQDWPTDVGVDDV